MKGTTKRLVGALVAFALLFAAVARAPGTMLTVEDGLVTFEICSGQGVRTVTLPVEGTDPKNKDTGCEFFAAQIAALPFGADDPVLALSTGMVAHRLPYRDIAYKRLAQNSYLTRGPPLSS